MHIKLSITWCNQEKPIVVYIFWGGQNTREGLKWFKQKENFDKNENKTKTNPQTTQLPTPPKKPNQTKPNKLFLKGVIITGG